MTLLIELTYFIKKNYAQFVLLKYGVLIATTHDKKNDKIKKMGETINLLYILKS